jgi:type III secretion protein T
MDDTIAGFLLAFPRAVAAIVTVPLLARQVVPGFIRVCLAMGIAGFAAVSTSGDASQDTAQINFMLLVAKEIGLGLLLSTSLGVLFWAVQAVGDYIDYYSGLTQSQQSDPYNGNQTSPLSLLFGQLGVTFFIASGGLVAYTVGVIDSYALWPPHSFVPTLSLKTLDWFVNHSSLLFAFGLILLTPVLAVLFLVDLSVGWVAKTATSMDIQSITNPIKAALACFLLALSLPAIFERLIREAGPFISLVRTMDAVLK